MQVGVGSAVKVTFHGARAKGWVLGPDRSESLPPRLIGVKEVISPVRFFDETMLSLARWMSERYVSPLAAVIPRLTPARVVSEEKTEAEKSVSDVEGGVTPMSAASVLSGGRYTGGDELASSIASRANSAWLLRPAPQDEVAIALDMVARALAAGRRAIVVVPESDPMPAVVEALKTLVGERLAVFAGGSARMRYRTWLGMQAGRYDVVVGTRPAVFAPLADLGLIVVYRESHSAHREEQAPYFHVRDVALKRAELSGATCVLQALCPSLEASALGLPQVMPVTRMWPPIEVVKPGPEGRSTRLIAALASTRRGFLLSAHTGYGIAAVCKRCSQPAVCAKCAGVLRLEEGTVRCVVCEAPGRCRNCGSAAFGIHRGGEERVEEWATPAARQPVRRVPKGKPRPVGDDEILVGGPDDVRDFGPLGLDLVAVLDADSAARRPGLTARESALATWMEAAAWAAPDGKVIVHSVSPQDAAVQALVRGNPDRFHTAEAARRASSGFPVGSAIFRIAGEAQLEGEIDGFGADTALISSVGGRTVCLVAIAPDRVAALGRLLRELAAKGVVTRVEAEPRL